MFNIPLLKPKVPLTGKLVLKRGANGLFTSYVPCPSARCRVCADAIGRISWGIRSACLCLGQSLFSRPLISLHSLTADVHAEQVQGVMGPVGAGSSPLCQALLMADGMGLIPTRCHLW